MRGIIHNTYKQLCKLGITSSANDFSRRLLGKSSRYYSWVLATGHEPDIGAMVGLYSRLDDLIASAEMAGDNTRAAALDDLTSKIWDSIRHQSLNKGPNRRKKPAGDDAQAGADH